MLNKKLESLREERDWSKARVARELGIPPTTYIGYENGLHMPTILTLIDIAKLYNVTLDYLMSYHIPNKNVPKSIDSISDAIIFLDNIKVLVKDKSDEEIIKFAQAIFYLTKK